MRAGAMALTLITGLGTVALAADALAADALAADASNPAIGAPAVPARSTPLPVAEGSVLAGLGFGDKPYLLGDGSAFASYIGQAARDIQRVCGPLEAFGWEIKGDDQRRVDMLTNSLIGSLKKSNMVVQLVKPLSLQRTEVVAYTADGKGRNLFLMLSLSPPPGRDQLAQLVLLICDTTRNK